MDEPVPASRVTRGVKLPMGRLALPDRVDRWFKRVGPVVGLVPLVLLILAGVTK